MKVLTTDEIRIMREIRDQAVADLDSRYNAYGNMDRLSLLQATITDGSFAQTEDMLSLGIVWGDLICQKSGAKWITAEWDGEKMFAINIPHTTILLFPASMLEKRRDQNEAVDFPFFLKNTLDTIEKMKANPEYRR